MGLVEALWEEEEENELELTSLSAFSFYRSFQKSPSPSLLNQKCSRTREEKERRKSAMMTRRMSLKRRTTFR